MLLEACDGRKLTYSRVHQPANRSLLLFFACVRLFVEAWGQVCSTPLAWWWSEQLCSWTAAPFTIFLYLECELGAFILSLPCLTTSTAAERYNIRRPWAYMLLGQVVAISFAQSLFLAAIALAPPPNPSVRASRDPNIDSTLNNATLGSLATVFFAFRSYSSPYFLANLLVMHILILIPLVPNPLPQVRKAATYSTLYTTTLFATLAIRFLTYRTVLASSPSTFPNIISLFHQLPGLAYTTFFSHPAQTSISFDVLFTTLSFIAFMLLTDTSLATRSGKTSVSPKVIAGAIALTPWLGIASTGAAYLAARELGIESYEAELKGVKKVE